MDTTPTLTPTITTPIALALEVVKRYRDDVLEDYVKVQAEGTLPAETPDLPTHADTVASLNEVYDFLAEGDDVARSNRMATLMSILPLIFFVSPEQLPMIQAEMQQQRTWTATTLLQLVLEQRFTAPVVGSEASA